MRPWAIYRHRGTSGEILTETLKKREFVMAYPHKFAGVSLGFV
jgi:hypothetical protein